MGFWGLRSSQGASLRKAAAFGAERLCRTPGSTRSRGVIPIEKAIPNSLLSLKILLVMGLAWQACGLGHLAKSIHGYYLVYGSFDNENERWFAEYVTGSNRFGEQVSRIKFQGFRQP
jgi:hypothetical protein